MVSSSKHPAGGRRSTRLWGIVPAAGHGQRFGSSRQAPKQYQALAHSTVIECALAPLLALPELTALVVALADDDRHWKELAVARHPSVRTAVGGASRAASVANALDALADAAPAARDWVIVHDAVRPCLSAERLRSLLVTLVDHPVGGLLAVPVRDSLKRVDGNGSAVETVPHTQLWRAQTPQLFRYAVLREALAHRLAHGACDDDEAAAVIASGHRPQVILGTACNLKLTDPEDLPLAQALLSATST